MAAQQSAQSINAKSSRSQSIGQIATQQLTGKSSGTAQKASKDLLTGPGTSAENGQETSDHRRLMFDQHKDQTEKFPLLPKGLKGRKSSLATHPSTRRRSTASEQNDVVSMLYNGTLPTNYFDEAQKPKPRRKSVAVPTYAYLSKDFNKENENLTPVIPESSGPTSKKRGVNIELRLQEAAWRLHQRKSSISDKARQHYKKVEEVKLNTEEADKKEMHRIEAATRKLYK